MEQLIEAINNLSDKLVIFFITIVILWAISIIAYLGKGIYDRK